MQCTSRASVRARPTTGSDRGKHDLTLFVSETYYKRQILAESTDSIRPEHVFKIRYQELEKTCSTTLHWQLLLPLSTDDDHHFQCLRIPANDEQRDFDELVLGLTKILIDSLNEKQLNKLIPLELRTELKGGIARLEAAFDVCGVDDAADSILFLRKLQSLRSSSAAHRKGDNYRKIANDFGMASQNLRVVFSEILQRSLGVLDCFIAVVRSEKLTRT